MSWTEEDRKVGLSGGVWQEVQMLEIELETLSRENKRRELQIHNFQDRLGQQIVKNKEVREELQSLQRDVQRLHNESKMSETSREHLSQKLKTKQVQVCRLEGQLDSAHILNKKLNEEVKRLGAENEKLQNQQQLDFYDVAPASSNKKTPRRHQSDRSHSFSPSAVFPEEGDDSMSAAIGRIETDNIQQWRDQETRDPLIGQLKQKIDNIQSSIDQLPNKISANIYTQMQMIMDNLQESILRDVQEIVKGEVSVALKEQQTSSIDQAMRSAAATPGTSTHLDYKAQKANILQLLQRGQINQAFQQALSATDLDLDLYVCETSYSYRVFQLRPCPLSQPILLSLIQHLSSNLTTFSELRISYLEEAVLNLDDRDPLITDVISEVLSQVKPKLSAFLQQEPHGPLSIRVELLLKLLSL